MLGNLTSQGGVVIFEATDPALLVQDGTVQLAGTWVGLERVDLGGEALGVQIVIGAKDA